MSKAYGFRKRAWAPRATVLFIAVASWMGWAVPSLVGDEPKKSDPAPSPPQIVMARPFGVVFGSNTVLTLRGYHLTNAVSARVVGLPEPVTAILKGANEAPKIDGRDNNQIGDQELKLELMLPSESPVGTNLNLVVVNSAGESAPYALVALKECDDAKESNRAFREAQTLSLGQWVRGVLPDGSAVHVYRIRFEAAHGYAAEILAARLGSTLDAALALYDVKGTVLAQNDDTFGRDPALTFHPLVSGDYFLVVTTVNERSSKVDDYLLRVDHKP